MDHSLEEASRSTEYHLWLPVVTTRISLIKKPGTDMSRLCASQGLTRTDGTSHHNQCLPDVHREYRGVSFQLRRPERVCHGYKRALKKVMA